MSMQRPTGRRARQQRAEFERSAIADFRASVQRINRYAGRVEKSCGVSTTQLWALREINREPGARVSDIALALGIHLSTASNLLDKLEERKLIRRQRGGPDQRTVSLFLTAAGKRLLLQVPGPPGGALDAAMQRMSDAEVRSLARCMRILRGAISDVD